MVVHITLELRGVVVQFGKLRCWTEKRQPPGTFRYWFIYCVIRRRHTAMCLYYPYFCFGTKVQTITKPASFCLPVLWLIHMLSTLFGLPWLYYFFFLGAMLFKNSSSPSGKFFFVSMKPLSFDNIRYAFSFVKIILFNFSYPISEFLLFSFSIKYES